MEKMVNMMSTGTNMKLGYLEIVEQHPIEDLIKIISQENMLVEIVAMEVNHLMAHVYLKISCQKLSKIKTL